MRKPAVALLVCLVAAALMSSPGFAKLEQAEATSAALINEAYHRGDLTHDEMILEKAYALYAPWKLRAELVGGQIDKCGTPMADEILRALPDLPEDKAEEIRGLRARPVCDTYTETTHFRIHYDTSGTHRIRNWPDTTYRDQIMTAAENCWNVEVTAMGFRAPPPDGGDPDGGGGNDKYDIYVQNLGTGLYGYTEGRYYYSGGDYPPNAATTIVVIDNDYTGFPHTPEECMQITVAHEFNHACQAAHDINESTWYKECSSVWMEEQIYDDVNDYYSYLSFFLNSLYRSISYHDGNLRWYGSCVWNFFLDQNVSHTIVPEMWDQMESSGQTLDMMDVVLATYGTSMEEQYSEFAVWCWFTGSRDDGNHFEEGGSWYPATIMRGHSIFPTVIGGPTPTWEPDYYGCNYIHFNYGGSGYDGLKVSYDGPQLLTTCNFAFLNYKPAAGQEGEYGEIVLNPWGVGDITFEGWNNMQTVALVVANCSDNTSNMNYSYQAEEVETGVDGEVDAFSLEPASPNPFTEMTSIAYSVPTGGGFVEITVYSASGREVRSLVRQRMDAGAGVAVWDGLDNAGQRVASGVYFARLDVDGLTASGKLMVLK